MKKFLLITIFFLLAGFSVSHSFDNDHHILLSWGGYNFHYLYPTTELEYQSPHISLLSLGFRVGLRSYGTPFLYTTGFYDIPITAELHFFHFGSSFSLFTGGGIAIWTAGKSSLAKEYSSVQPLFLIGIDWMRKRWQIELPIRFRFYNDGFTTRFALKSGFKIVKWFGVVAWVEMDIISKYGHSNADIYGNMFIGVEFKI